MTMTSEYVIGFSAGASACTYIFKQVLSMVKDHQHPRNGASGDKSVDFWKATHAEVVRDQLQPYLERNQEALQVIRDNTTKLAYIAERYWK